ncbi:MAG: glycosyltransferase [Desulfurivibrionaceae bacterium]
MNPGKKITVLHLRNRFAGDYPLINQVILGLNEGYKHIVCYLTDNGNKADSLLDLGYNVIWLPYAKKDLRHFRYGVVKELDRIVRDNDVDIIHAHRHKPTFYGLLAARKNRDIKLVSTIHGMNRTRTLARRIQNRILWPRAHAFICVSESVRQDVISTNPGLDPGRLRVLYNGIDLKPLANVAKSKEEIRREWGLPPDRWLWGTAGRLVPVKGHEVLLKAWAGGGLKERGGHLVIAGEGPLRTELERLSQDLGIDDNVTLPGKTANIPDFLNALDGFVMPSWKEGFGLALLEAMAAGLPIVASETGGIPEILSPLTENSHSYMVEPGQKEDLAKAMNAVMSWSPEKYSQAVAEIKEKSSFFDARTMIAETDGLYKEIAGVN